jgi:hypothetical protein
MNVSLSDVAGWVRQWLDTIQGGHDRQAVRQRLPLPV